MAIDRTNSGQPGGAPQRGPAAVSAPAARGPLMAGDQLAFSSPRRTAAPETFSWGRAGGHFWHGFKREFLDGLEGAFKRPLTTLAWLAGSVAVVAALPLILPVSAAAVGTAMAVSFVGFGLFKAGQGAYSAIKDYRAGNTAKAEDDFEQIGRGSFDVAAVVVPAAATRAATILAQSQAGEAVIQMVQQGAVGRTAGAALEAVGSV
ncbi:MAG: hypothetical protein JWM80_305, partial [Cyanobacteria bacterium RYN_339]|nr:hypothetical protein [Cyanobacteria bacterium RYN_339]